MPKRSEVLVLLQVIFVLQFFYKSPLLARNPLLLTLELVGITLSGWAIIIMVLKSKISPFPELVKGARLLKSGPYKYIRNPMYTGLMIMMIALLTDRFSIMRLFVLIAEIAVLLEKINIEEKQLAKIFKEYSSYKSVTKRLIPFIY